MSNKKDTTTTGCTSGSKTTTTITTTTTTPLLPSSPSKLQEEQLPDRIAKCALHHYHTVLPGNKGKPKPNEEWTVYAAFVASSSMRNSSQEQKEEDRHSSDDIRLWVVSCATGTKCTAGTSQSPSQDQEQRKDTITTNNGISDDGRVVIQDYILHDSHAEVLARRGLLRVLWQELMSYNRQYQQQQQQQHHPQDYSINNNYNNLLIPCHKHYCHDEAETKIPSSLGEGGEHQSSPPMFQWNPNIQLHMYISDSPCGDASIYPIQNRVNNNTNNQSQPEEEEEQQTHSSFLSFQEQQYTGAKIVVSNSTGVSVNDCGGCHQLLQTTTITKSINSATKRQENTNDDSVKTTSGTKKNIVVAREEIQLLGKLRTKSGRSNIPPNMRSTSMSCSDKIALWGVIGLQGAILDSLLVNHHQILPLIPLTSIVVSQDPRVPSRDDHKNEIDDDNNNNNNNQNGQWKALHRAIPSRIKQAYTVLMRSFENQVGLSFSLQQQHQPPTIPSIHVVSSVFESGKACILSHGVRNAVPPSSLSSSLSMACRKRKRRVTEGDIVSWGNNNNCINKIRCQPKISPCGLSLNWNQWDDVSHPKRTMELVVGARGIRQGAKKKVSGKGFPKQLASRLCRANMVQSYSALLQSSLSSSTSSTSNSGAWNGTESYHQWKQRLVGKDNYNKIKTILFTERDSPFVGWIRNDNNVGK
jgi:hypothetical protein